jgi:catechol 2,3-dioxygenase-like lactoylglutathione lyase family enzyme
MIAHTSIAVGDFTKAKDFYQKALAPVGYTLHMDLSEYEAAGFMEGGHTSFWISAKENPQPTHIAFQAKNKKAVDEFHKAALGAGGKDNGAPGYRKDYSPGYYAAFVHDPDGNNIEAVWYDPEQEK